MLVTAVVCYAIETCVMRKVYVVDGDTIKLGRESVRIEGIDAPELKGKCDNEKNVAEQAKDRLVSLISGDNGSKAVTLTITPHGRDRFGRTLATVESNGWDVGRVLLKEGLAREWTKVWDGKPEPWCAASVRQTGSKAVEYLGYLRYLKHLQ